MYAGHDGQCFCLECLRSSDRGDDEATDLAEINVTGRKTTPPYGFYCLQEVRPVKAILEELETEELSETMRILEPNALLRAKPVTEQACGGDWPAGPIELGMTGEVPLGWCLPPL